MYSKCESFLWWIKQHRRSTSRASTNNNGLNVSNCVSRANVYTNYLFMAAFVPCSLHSFTHHHIVWWLNIILILLFSGCCGCCRAQTYSVRTCDQHISNYLVRMQLDQRLQSICQSRRRAHTQTSIWFSGMGRNGQWACMHVIAMWERVKHQTQF